MPHPLTARLCSLLLGAATLAPAAAFGQINDLDGPWRGTLACGELRDAAGRSQGPAFSTPLELSVSLGAITGRRENARVIETYNGSVRRSGEASLEASGHRWDGSGSRWRIRLAGTQSGGSMALKGRLETVVDKTQWRDCQLSLAHAVPAAAATAARPPAAPAAPVAPAAPPTVNWLRLFARFLAVASHSASAAALGAAD